MRAMGIDVGTVRIGVAISVDRTAVPAATIPGSDAVDATAERIQAAAVERDCQTIVIGLPKGMSGRDTKTTQRVRAVARAVERYGRDVVLFDERLTSMEANRALAQTGKTSAQRRGQVDEVAATIILQAWLDSQTS